MGDHAANSVILLNQLLQSERACSEQVEGDCLCLCLVERGLRNPERLPAVADVPEPGLLPQAPAAVESDRGVVETPPGCLTELVHYGWLPCTGRLVSSLIQGICTHRRVSWS